MARNEAPGRFRASCAGVANIALLILDENKLVRGPATAGADEGYDARDFIAEYRALASSSI